MLLCVLSTGYLRGLGFSLDLLFSLTGGKMFLLSNVAMLFCVSTTAYLSERGFFSRSAVLLLNVWEGVWSKYSGSEGQQSGKTFLRFPRPNQTKPA